MTRCRRKHSFRLLSLRVAHSLISFHLLLFSSLSLSPIYLLPPLSLFSLSLPFHFSMRLSNTFQPAVYVTNSTCALLYCALCVQTVCCANQKNKLNTVHTQCLFLSLSLLLPVSIPPTHTTHILFRSFLPFFSLSPLLLCVCVCVQVCVLMQLYMYDWRWKATAFSFNFIRILRCMCDECRFSRA